MPGHKGDVVIVEDDAGLNQAVVRLLQAAGFRASSFESAAAALASDAIDHADCLVLDVHLADMTGFELQRRLASAGRSPPTIIITAHDDASSRKQAVAMGARAYLAKPFAGRALVEAVASVVKNSGLR